MSRNVSELFHLNTSHLGAIAEYHHKAATENRNKYLNRVLNCNFKMKFIKCNKHINQNCLVEHFTLCRLCI